MSAAVGAHSRSHQTSSDKLEDQGQSSRDLIAGLACDKVDSNCDTDILQRPLQLCMSLETLVPSKAALPCSMTMVGYLQPVA